MADYIDGFVFPIPKIHLEEYRSVAKAVAGIWKEHGALAYFEYQRDDIELEGIRSFPECLGTRKDDVIIFGWVVFESRESRDRAHDLVSKDSRMNKLITPIMDPSRMIFDPKLMVYGGFKSLVP